MCEWLVEKVGVLPYYVIVTKTHDCETTIPKLSDVTSEGGRVTQHRTNMII